MIGQGVEQWSKTAIIIEAYDRSAGRHQTTYLQSTEPKLPVPRQAGYHLLPTYRAGADTLLLLSSTTTTLTVEGT